MALPWYYRHGGETCGPISRDELKQLVAEGQLDKTCLVWREGMADWASIASLGAQREGAAPPPPPSPPPPPLVTTAVPMGQAVPLYRPPPPRHNGPPPDTSRWILLGGVGTVAVVLAFAVGWLVRDKYAKDEQAVAAASATRWTPEQREEILREETKARNRPLRLKEKLAKYPVPTTTPPEAPLKQPVPSSATPPALPTEETNPAPVPITTGVPVPVPATPTPAPEPAKPASPPDPQPTPSTPITPTQAQPQEETLFQEVDVQRKPTFSVLGVVTEQDLRYQLLSQLTITPPNAQGVRTVNQHVLDTKLIQSDDLSRPMFEQSLKALRGTKFSYQVGSGGEVEKLAVGPPDGRKAAAVEPKGGAGFRVSSVMDASGWRELAQLSFFLPDLQQSGNQAWTRPMTHDFGPLGSWTGETRFVRQGTKAGVLRVDYAHHLKYLPPEKDRGELPFAIKDALFTTDVAAGSILFDTAAGRVQAAQEQFQVHGEIATDLLGEAASVQVGEQQAISLRILTKNPWEQ